MKVNCSPCEAHETKVKKAVHTRGGVPLCGEHSRYYANDFGPIDRKKTKR